MLRGLVLVGFLFQAIGLAQEWVQLQPTFDPPGDYNLSAGTFVDENHGWIAEFSQGKIWKTTNGGHNWELLVDTTSLWFHSIEFIDTTHGWIAAENSAQRNKYIFRTIDGGRTWEAVSVPNMYVTNFIDPGWGVAGGDTVWHTTDGGRTWDAVSVTPAGGFGIFDFAFIDNQRGWAVGGSTDAIDAGAILKTVDGGLSWQALDLDAAAALSGVCFVDSLYGGAVGITGGGGKGAILMTYNGGQTWEDVHLSPIPFLWDIHLLDDGTGWAVGNDGYLMFTADSGTTWEKINLGIDANLAKISFVAGNRVGYIFGKHNTLFRYERALEISEPEQRNTPELFILYQNYPNPFNLQTTIAYALYEPAIINLTVYDLKSHPVATLLNSYKGPGRFQVIWDGTDEKNMPVSSGLYSFRLTTGKFSQVRKMLIIK